ncbi:2-polyprenyl-3-methyl-6-methoxy-1,4-benzoquinone monooxygenase [Piscinibacterium candidicorallinum]|uniref:3-demethoxyubiquinol 3-hydroxylase n=1 Tax=Piscinibacterium candidicorallinum TaxID=1793872 RepID=A0ABV7H5A5_9BURK
MKRSSSPVDSLVVEFDIALRTLTDGLMAARSYPAEGVAEAAQPTELSGQLMRVNHTGEVCAQALYQGHALGASTPALNSFFRKAAREEQDHLAWTAQRLKELGSRPSYLNPLWYAGALALGFVSAKLSDGKGLGLMSETERQVEAHLAGHLERLPADDMRSRSIVDAMKADEAHHADEAERLGADAVPEPLKALMRASAKVMTTVAHHV